MDCLSSKQATCQTAVVAIPETVGVVVGENLQRLRERARLTQHEASHLLLRRGTPWHRSKIAAIEAGERPNVALADVLMLADTLNVELAEFFEGDGDVALNQYVTVSRPKIRDMIRGSYALGGSDDWDPETRRDELFGLAQIRADGEGGRLGATAADRTLARRWDVPLRAVTEIAIELWDRTLTDERDFRVDQIGDMEVGERQARRGHITRELSQQIEGELRKRGLLADPPDPPEQTEENEEEG